MKDREKTKSNFARQRKTGKEPQEYRQQLERMVKKRTAQLKMVNEILKQENIERMKIEQALRESEERYRAFFEQAADSIAFIDAETGELAEFNNRAHETLGYTREEFKNLRIQDFEVIESAEEVARHIEKVVRQGSDTFETKHRTKEGQIRDVLVNCRAISVGRRKFIQCIWRDITERKKREDELRKSEEKFRLAFENAKDAIFWADAETGIIINCNKAAETLLEKTKREIIGKHQTLLHPPQKAKYYGDMFKKHVKKKTAAGDEAEVITKSGKIINVHISASVTLVGERPVIQGIFRDITERKQAEEKIKQAAEEWNKTFDAMTDLVAILDAEYRIIRANKAFFDKCNQGQEEIIGRKCYEVLHKSDRPWPDCAGMKTVKDGTPRTEETFDADTGCHFLISNSPIFNAGGEVVGIVHVAKDITERKKAEKKNRELAAAEVIAAIERAKAEELKKAYNELRNMQLMLIQSEKLCALGQLGSGIAHKLNSPLSGVLSLIRTYMKEKKRGSEEYKDLKDMEETCEHMAEIIKELNIFARKSTSEFVKLDINNVIESTLSFSAYLLEKNNIKIEKRYGRNLPPVKGDKNQLQQVVLNMMTNARDAVTGKGVFRITTRARGTAKGRFVDMEFSDTGCGINEENIEKIFEPFFTTKELEKGVGLGLAIVRTIVNSHKGKITVKSKPGKGTVFTVRLPAKT